MACFTSLNSMTSNDGSSSAFSSFFSFLIPSSQSHKTALLIGSVAVVSSVTTASVIFGIQSTNRKSKRADLEERVRRATRESGLGHSSNEKDHHSNSSTLSHSLLKHKSSKHLGIPNSRSSLLSRNAARSSDDAESMTTEGGTPRYLSMIQGGGGSSSITPSSSSLSIPRRRENYDESLIREQLTRNYSFLGEEGMSKVRNSFVVIVGAGGVGSWAALMLLRSGISNIRIIDFDQVSTCWTEVGIVAFRKSKNRCSKIYISSRNNLLSLFTVLMLFTFYCHRFLFHTLPGQSIESEQACLCRSSRRRSSKGPSLCRQVSTNSSLGKRRTLC